MMALRPDTGLEGNPMRKIALMARIRKPDGGHEFLTQAVNGVDAFRVRDGAQLP